MSLPEDTYCRVCGSTLVDINNETASINLSELRAGAHRGCTQNALFMQTAFQQIQNDYQAPRAPIANRDFSTCEKIQLIGGGALFIAVFVVPIFFGRLPQF